MGMLTSRISGGVGKWEKEKRKRKVLVDGWDYGKW